MSSQTGPGQAARFVVVGAVSVVADTGCLIVLHGTVGLGLAPATVGAYALGFLVNFVLNRTLTFRSTAPVGRGLVRYAGLVAGNLLVTASAVPGLAALGVYYVVAKLLVTGLLSVGNFFAYRHWVFRAGPVAA